MGQPITTFITAQQFYLNFFNLVIFWVCYSEKTDLSKLEIMEHTASTVNGCLEAALLKYVSKEVFCDVTLVSDDFQLFPAHKLVLAAHSPVLERLLLS